MSRRAGLRSPLPRVALCQLLGLTAAWALAGTLPLAALVWVSGAVAAGLGIVLRLPIWWLPLQLLFAPALLAAQSLAIHPGWYLAAFVLTLLVLGNSVGERVPLYLSSQAVWRQLAALLPAQGRFVDLGCGTGGGLAALSRLRPQASCLGVESSPLVWLICRLRLLSRARCQVRLASLWSVELGEFDLVYAFLSPAPMARLWEKARREMRPGSLLVSNSFQVPGVAPDRVIELDDRRRSRLYVWEMG